MRRARKSGYWPPCQLGYPKSALQQQPAGEVGNVGVGGFPVNALALPKCECVLYAKTPVIVVYNAQQTFVVTGLWSKQGPKDVFLFAYNHPLQSFFLSH